MEAAAVALAAAVGVYGAAYGKKYYDFSGDNELNYFQPSEFGIWFPLMDAELLLMLDAFRGSLGEPVIVSPVVGAIGRKNNEGNANFNSLHNVLKWGKVRAIDVMLPNSTLEQGYNAARAAGFSGIGVYPDWQPHKGMHLDNRPNRTANFPATWSARNINGVQVYGAINEVVSV